MGWDGGPGLDGCGSTIRTHIPATTAPFGLWSPHHTRIRHRLPLPHEMRRERPLQFFFFEFLLGKKTLTDHHQEHLCLCLCTCSLRPVRFFFGANRSVLRRRRCIAVARSHGDQIIGGSSPPFLSRAFSFFSFPYAQLAPLSLDFE